MMKKNLVARLGVLLLGGLLLPLAMAEQKGNWIPLIEDGLHDPTNPALGLLQNPSEVLSKLPYDKSGNLRTVVVGNQVKWVKALNGGFINPRTSFESADPNGIKVLDLNILLTKRNTGEIPRVLFPHKQHTQWLDCSNCHEWLFKSKAGANTISMYEILNGEYCGRCHGAVAFPLTQCQRCHRIPFDVDIPRVSKTSDLPEAYREIK